MTLAERIAARLSGISTDRYMFGLFGEGRMGEGGFGKLQILGKTKHVTRCQNCGRAGLKHAVVCAVVGEDGHPTNQYYYFGTDCAAKLAGKAEKDVEAEAEHQESSGRPRMKNLKPAKPNEGQMELSLRFAAAWQAHVERYGRVKPTRGQAAFDFDALASAPQAEPAAGKPAAVEPPALPSKGKQMGLFDQPQAAAPAAEPASDWDEKKHPRWDAGDKQHHGGQFSPKAESKPHGAGSKFKPPVTGKDWALSPDFHYQILNDIPVDEGDEVLGSQILHKRIGSEHPLWRLSVVKSKDGRVFTQVEQGKEKGGNLGSASVAFQAIDGDRLESSKFESINNAARKLFDQHKQGESLLAPKQAENPAEQPAQFDFAAIVKEARAKGQNIHAAAREAGVPSTHENKRALMQAVNDLPPEEPKIGPGQARGQAKFNEARAKEEQPAPSGFEPYQHDRYPGKWLVPSKPGQRGFGDTLHSSREDALAEAGRVASRHEKQKAAEGESEATAKAEAEKKAAFKASGMTSQQAALQARIQAHLGQQVNYKGSPTSRQALIDRELAEGHKPAVIDVPDEAARKKAEASAAFMLKQGVPTGNENHPDTIKLRKLQEQAKSAMKKEHIMDKGDGIQRPLSKMEHDYAASKYKPQASEQPAEPKGKEPWQITRQDYIKQSAAIPASGGFAARANAKIAAPYHREQVKSAFESGKPVPAEVLADYPELQKPAVEAEGSLASGKPKSFASATEVAGELQAIRNELAGSDPDHDSLRARLDAAGGWIGSQKKTTTLLQKLASEAHSIDDKLKGGSGKRGNRLEVVPEAEGSGSPTAPATVGEKVAAAIAKKSMDFGRKVEVRKDRAKKLGPREKTEEPAEQVEGWARRYKIARIDKSRDKSEEGKYAIYDTRTKSRYTGMGHRQATSKLFESESEAKAALPILEVARNHGVYQSQDGKSYEIRRKFDRHSALVKGGFSSRDEAARHMAMNPHEIINHKFPSYETYQYLTEVKREGPERRKGEVNERDFQEAFNPGGAVFGNWMSNKDGVAAFHHAHDSLHDLADVLEIHPQQVSLDGDLVYGFGAAGSGGKNAARAHYEPRQRLINLTKMAGAGSLAHEWWHALDHFIAKHHQLDSHTAVGSKASYMKGDEGLKKAIKDLHHALHNTAEDRVIEAHDKAQDEKEAKRLQYRAEERQKAIENNHRIPYAESVGDYLHNIKFDRDRTAEWKKKKVKPELLKEYDELEAKIAAGDHGEEVYVPSKSKWGLGTTTYANIKALDDVHKKITGRSFLVKDNGNDIYHQFKIDKAKAQDKAARAAKAGQTERVFRPSTFSREAAELDRSRASSYYTLPEEMGARAFEAYIADKLNEKGIRSDYLIGKGKTSNAVYRAFGLPGPFPEGEERKQINEAFDKLMVEVRKHLRKPEKEKHSLSDEARELNERVSRLVERYSEAGELQPGLKGQQDNHPHWETPEFKSWFGQSKAVQPSGKPLRVFHGSKRPDRIGNEFKANRATSGPMSFFTDDPDIASSYATGKQDTSLEMPESYAGWFKYKPPGSRGHVSLDHAWYHLPHEQKQAALERLPHVNINEEGEISHKHGQGTVASGWDYYLKREGQGNPIKAARAIWLDSGALFNDEHRFLEVLKHAGIDTSNFHYESPWHEQPGVHAAWLSIQNPLDTANIPDHVHDALHAAGRLKRGKTGSGADQWDKRHVSGRDWLQRLAEDKQNGTTHAWTSIPDWATKALKSLGYDGIKDSGGKNGGPGHSVWIPFGPHQIKSAMGNRGTYDSGSKKITYGAGGQVERYSAGGHDERHIAVGKRFGIPPEAVKSALETHPDELAKRDEYMPPSSGRESAVGPTTDHPKHPIGTAKIDLMRHKAGEADDAYVEYLREFNPAELVTSEAEDGVTKSPSFGKYVEWAKAGQQPPPITVFSKPGGKMVSTNRRRVLAAQQAGSKSIVGWHGVDNPETGLPLKYGDLKRAFAEAAKPQNLLDSQGQGLLFSRTGQTQRGLFGDDYEAKPLGKQESHLPSPPEPIKQHKPKPNQQSLFSAVADAMGVRVERYAAEQAPSPWFLKSRELLKQKMGQHAPASQVLALLKNNQISPEELEWTGLENHLRSKGNSPVSQQELHDLIGKFGVEESVLGDNGYSPGLQSLIKQVGWNEESHGPLHLHLKRMADDAYRDGDHDDANWIDDYAKEAYEKQQATIRPKYGKYSLPGGENYREMLLKLPSAVPSDRDGMAQHLYGRRFNELNTNEAARVYNEIVSPTDGKTYQSSHWAEPNVLAHIRYKDYVGPDGKKHLHIDEIQSDWHQQGRKQGYEPTEQEIAHSLARSKELTSKGELTPEERDELAGHGRVLSKRDNVVPSAPFKKNWHMLAMKRMLHHAAANGYDRVTWTPGEEHADRYRLDRHLRAIHYHPERKTITAIGLNGETHLDGQVKDGKIHAPSEHREFHGKTLADVFGHEIAHKLETGTPQAATGKVSIAGKDLHIGGIGMRKFYDQMLPADTNKLIKRHGGKVGQFDLHLPEHSDGGGYEAKPPRAIKVHGFDITPSMKAEATSGKGQSMFSVYEEPDLQIERYEQTGANPPGLQPRFRMGAGEQRAAEQFTKIPSTKPPAIFSFLGKAAGLVGKAAGKAAGMAKGAAGQAADKALGAIQPTADKLAGKIGGAAESLDRKGQAAMSKVGMAPKPAPTPAKAPKAQAGAEKPATQGVKAGAPVRLAQAHDIHGNGRQMIPEGTQGTYIGPHSQKGHAEVEIGGIRHVIPTKSLGYSVEHTDHKAIEQHKQTQAEQAQKQKQLTARQRAEAVPEGMEKAERKSLHVSSHDLQPGDVIHHGQPGAHPYGRVLEVHPDGKHVVVEEATPSKGSPDGIATTGRRLTIPGHEKMEGGGSATRMFHTKRLPDEARPIGERKEYKDFFEGAKQLGVHDDVAHEMAMQLWDDSQAMRTPKGFKDGAKVQTEEQMKAPFKANWQQAQEAKDAKNAPAPAQSAPAQPAAKPRHHVSNLQAGDAIRPLKGSESKVNLRYLGPGSSKGFITVEHPQFGKQEVSTKSVGLLMPKQGGRKVPAMSGRDQMAERAAIMEFDGGLNRKQAARAAVIERGRQNAPDLHQVKRSDFALQRQGVLAKDKQGNGFLLYGGKRYPLSQAEFDGNKLVSDPVKIRERIHREQIKALASQDPAAVPAHVKAEYEHHFDRWAGNSPFAKGGGKQPQRQSAKNQPNVGQMSLSPGMAVQPQAPQTPPVLQPPIEARRQAQRVVNADPRGIDTEIDPNRPQAQIDRREAANRAFMDAIAAKFNQNQPAGGLAASPPPTQPVVAASAPPAVSNPAQEQKTPLWQLTRPHKMGRNEVNVQFDSAKQRDLHDYAASVANARSFSGKAGRGKPSGAEQQRAKLKAVADAHFGGNMDAAHQEALQVRAHVKAHMAGAQDGEHRVIPPLGVQPAKPQAPEQPAGDDTMPWDRPFEPKAFKPASPEKAQAHTENVLRGHLKEFARMEAAKTERLRQLWKQFRTAMGVPGDRRFSEARKFQDAVAQGADREGTMQKNWDVVAPQLAREAPSHFAGDDRDDKIWKFLSGDPPEPLKWHDEELAKKFWKRVHPSYGESLEQMNRGEAPLERLNLNDFLSDSTDDWQESSRWQDDTGPYRASANAFVERFSAAWPNRRGSCEKEGIKRSRKSAGRSG